jgi:hypothetical protein
LALGFWRSAYEGGAPHQAKLIDLPRATLKRKMAMTAAERKLIDKNLDLIFEFEKYVLEHPEVGKGFHGTQWSL